MTFREIEYLTESSEFKNFVFKYTLKLKLFNNEKIYLISKCFVFEIYGLVVEDIFYFELYTNDLKYHTSISRLLSDFETTKLRVVYNKQIATRKQVLIRKLQGHEKTTLKAEQYFFAMLQLMDEFLSDILSCKKEIRKEHWSECDKRLN